MFKQKLQRAAAAIMALSLAFAMQLPALACSGL